MCSTIFAISTSLIALAAISATSATAAVPGDIGNAVVERGRQPQPGDDRGGGRQPQPGDDRGGRNIELPKPVGNMILGRQGHGKDDAADPCDDHGVDGACRHGGSSMLVARRGADDRPGDDRGGQRPRGTRTEPGDDRGAGR